MGEFERTAHFLDEGTNKMLHRSILVPMVLAGFAPLLMGCGAGPGAASSEQHQSETTEFTKLATCTPQEAADVVDELFNGWLDEVLDAHPEIEVVTHDNLHELTQVGYVWYSDLREAIARMLDDHQVDEATPDWLRESVNAWAVSIMELDDDGNAAWDTSMPLVAYSAIERANRENAFAQARNPRGVVISELDEQWREVTTGSALDHAFLLPVKVSRTPEFHEVRDYFHGRWVAEYAWGYEAIDAFWHADEGPEGHPAFAPIAEALSESSITRRWYMGDEGKDYGAWSRNYLVVLDEHQQLYGFMMGYSE